MFSNVSEIYNLLIQDDITNSEGEIVFNFLNVSTRINEKKRDWRSFSRMFFKVACL